MVFGKKHRSKKSPSKEIVAGGTESILSALYKNITHTTGLNEPEKWNHLMMNYLLNPRNRIPRNNKDQSSARGNLNKELLKDTMSWKVFCKGIQFLNIFKFELIIRPYHGNGKITEHKIMVNLPTSISHMNEEEKETDESSTN